MSAITLEQAQAHLAAWMKASLDVATKGQAYVINSDGTERSLTRVNAEHIDRMIKFWEAKVAELTLAGATSANNGSQIIYAGRVR
jgi:hypothetical protein